MLIQGFSGIFWYVTLGASESAKASDNGIPRIDPSKTLPIEITCA